MEITGRVTQGLGDYGVWLAKYKEVYRRATGLELFPGTLNLELTIPFDLPANCQRLEAADYGGAVNVNLVPCLVFGRRAVLLRTDANQDGTGPHPKTIVEIATDVKLRDEYGLQDGDLVTVEMEPGAADLDPSQGPPGVDSNQVIPGLGRSNRGDGLDSQLGSTKVRSMEIYDAIGTGYRELRRADPRLAAGILEALGTARSVINVGAGAGSYEPRGRAVVAVEPSTTMIRQRAADAARVVQGTAEALPVLADSFDASLAILTIHHWPNLPSCLAELRRVSRHKIAILTWDPGAPGFWLTDYFPEILEIDRRIFPSIEFLTQALGPTVVTEVPIPRDCTDGFLGAYWARPEAYLAADVRSAISTFTKLGDLDSGLAQLKGDLASGSWEQKYGDLLHRDSLDLGYRLVVASSSQSTATKR